MKAIIKIGGKQYIVAENQSLLVDHLAGTAKSVELEPLMVFDEKTTKVGTPVVKGASVKAEVVEPEVKGEKIHVMKFKSKKREKTMTGHRQTHTRIKIKTIAA